MIRTPGKRIRVHRPRQAINTDYTKKDFGECRRFENTLLTPATLWPEALIGVVKKPAAVLRKIGALRHYYTTPTAPTGSQLTE